MNKMKSIFTFLTLLFVAALFTGCSKTTEAVLSPEDQAVKYLTGDGNRYWHLKKIYVNGIAQALTTSQLQYTKTYTINPSLPYSGSFTNYDGYIGTWKLQGIYTLKETITNNPAGPVPAAYDINLLNETTLDIELTANLKTVREVYNAY
jgi:hypothetical protein